MAKIKSNVTSIAVDTIECPMYVYPRTKLPGAKDVQHLIGVDFPPITTAQIKDEDVVTTVVVDGAHRLQAAKEQGDKEIQCEDLGLLEPAEVLEEAIRRNRSHGKQLSMADKAKLAKLYAGEGSKISEIVSMLSVGERTVSRWVSEAKEAKKLKDFATVQKNIKKGMSVAGAAREAGVARSTAQGWIDNPPEPKERAPKRPKADLGLTNNPANDECPDRVEALADMIIQDCADICKELENTSWVELAEAVYAKVKASYPKSWKS